MRRNPKELAATNRTLSRRALLLGGMQAGVVGALVLRMRYLQVDQAAQYRMLAEENRINIRLIAPDRGELFDRNGIILAHNSPSYRIIIVREDAGDVDQVIARLSQLVPLDPEDIERALVEMHRSAPFLPVTLTDKVSWEDISRVAVNAPALPGITPEVGLTRVYPRAADFAHIIGYVGPVSEYDLSKIEDPDQLLRIPRFQIGKVGLEAKREEILRGSAGAKRVEVNATGRVMRELSRRDGRQGADLQLSIDADLQAYVQARLGNESASAVVIDCENGDLRAIASSPSFDPNLFVNGISVADYRGLTEDPYRPLADKSVQGTYPPASTFKMVVAMAAMEEGLVDPEDTVYCRGFIEVSGRRFHCWKRAGHGSVNLKDAIKQSCDVYFYDTAMKIGIDKISAMAKKFGIGVAHDLPMSAVARGLAPNKAWKEINYGKDWLIGDTVNAGIGQGYVLASPLQLAVMSARLATGRSVTPRLIRTIDGVEQPSGAGEKMDVNENNLRRVREAMFAVSNDRRGTAYRSRIIDDTMRMAGKTGTAQVRSISMAERNSGVINEALMEWEQRDHALFVSFAPYDNPKFAVSVVVEHGGGGSKAAAPVARDILLQALFNGTPPLGAYPVGDRKRIEAQQERLQRERLRGNTNESDRA
ncbi:MAG: penicillin-binding protein 2 [Rhodobacteraceae bacterium]|nr:MAG: penicillin-binding protein 2 [Paracoccaceae bacterium]